MTVSTTALAGQLSPPVGPVQATRTIPLHPQDLTFPHTITESGHYVLTGHVDVPSGVDGFHIASHLVTLDLGGFRINAEDPDDPATAIVGVLQVQNGIIIRNGSIADWGSSAINLSGALLSSVEDITVIGVTNGTGIWLGEQCVVDDCRVSDCGVSGIQTGGGCMVRDTIVEGCASDGIVVSSGSMVLRCNSVTNDTGIVLGDQCVADDCRVSDCGASGIRTGLNCTVRDTVVEGCGGFGIVVLNESMVLRCNSSGNNGDGIVGFDSSIIESCIAARNGSVGIGAELGSVIRKCTSTLNTLVGMRARTGTSIIDCMIVNEVGIGALVEGEMLRCAVLGTGGKGVSLEGAGGRIIDSLIDGASLEGIELVRRGEVINCTVRNCRQEGIVARFGADFSRIIGNSLFANGQDHAGMMPVSALFGGVHIDPGARDCLVDRNSLVKNDAGVVIEFDAIRTTVIRNHAQDNNISSLGLHNYDIVNPLFQDLTLQHSSYSTAGQYDNIDK